MKLIEIKSDLFDDLTLAKSYLKVDNSNDDSVIQLMLDSAVDIVEDYLSFDLRNKRYIQYNNDTDTFPIERGYVSEIISVQDENGDDLDYEKYGDWMPDISLSAGMPDKGCYTTFETDIASDTIEEIYKIAIFMQLSHIYENRGDTDITPEVAKLLKGKRIQLWL